MEDVHRAGGVMGILGSLIVQVLFIVIRQLFMHQAWVKL
jgi:hypothetical protein